MKNGSRSATTLPENAALPFVIPTEAYPDFLFVGAKAHPKTAVAEAL
jgi:hypothetical protein